MKQRWFPIVAMGLALGMLAMSARRGGAQWPVGMGFRGPGVGTPGAGGLGMRGGGYSPLVIAPFQGGYNQNGYGPNAASIPSAAYFTYGNTSYTTESPSPIPVYSPRQAYAPLPPPTFLTALLQVQTPPDAEVWLEGQKMRSTGMMRHFRSPPLNPAKGYIYEVRLRWQFDGKPIEDVRHVAIRAGATVFVDFTHLAAPAPKPAAPAESSQPTAATDKPTR
ncbi:MAG TPA: TIGR03000 domain-containing protein [Gemmataceae bacterium]|nr:TIGR03000 domain-containing protein [Gemmataceae bacterium]